MIFSLILMPITHIVWWYWHKICAPFGTIWSNLPRCDSNTLISRSQASEKLMHGFQLTHLKGDLVGVLLWEHTQNKQCKLCFNFLFLPPPPPPDCLKVLTSVILLFCPSVTAFCIIISSTPTSALSPYCNRVLFLGGWGWGVSPLLQCHICF